MKRAELEVGWSSNVIINAKSVIIDGLYGLGIHLSAGDAGTKSADKIAAANIAIRFARRTVGDTEIYAQLRIKRVAKYYAPISIKRKRLFRAA